MTYLQFHLVFLLPVLVVLGFLLARKPRAHRPAFRFIPLLALIAFIYTTPWDNYLVASGIWGYGSERVIATVGYVPVEEYAFFILQPFLTGMLLHLLLTGRSPDGTDPPRSFRTSGLIVFSLLTALGVFGLTTISGRYGGLILAWAAPVALGQWWLGWRSIWTWRRPALAALTASTVYLWIADATAIAAGIWEIAPETTTGLGMGPLPVEEALFFLMTNVMVVQGLLLFIPGGALARGATGRPANPTAATAR